MKIFAISIGVTYTDYDHYGESLTPLPSCTTDAKYIHEFGKIFNYDYSTLLLNNQATVANVKNEIIHCSEIAKPGDLVFIFYSGHGSFLVDTNLDEPTGMDQTWCLYDRQIIDDEFRHLWKKFDKGVNILLILDSCHSGTAFKSVKNQALNTFELDYTRMVKSISDNNTNAIFQNNKDLYKPIMNQPFVQEHEVKCSVLGISACQDDEEALAGPYLSLFTRLLITTLSTESHKINNYNDLVQLITAKSQNLEQITPNMSDFGRSSDFFSSNKPFLKSGETYPDSIHNLYSDLVFGNSSVLNRGLGDNGIIVDIQEKSEKKSLQKVGLNRLVTLSEVNSTFLVSDTKLAKSISHPWDRAYELYEELKLKGIDAHVEPDLIPADESIGDENKGVKDSNTYLKTWPKPPVGHPNEFIWHLDNEHSQLAAARDFVKNNLSSEELQIKIAQIDTGYSPHHPAIPENISNGISFIKSELGQPAHDKPTPKWIEQEDHGTATASILAGKKVPEELAYGKGSRTLGAIPFAHVHPIRISDTVALTAILGNTMPFVHAIENAITEKCEVVTMSMGGLPTRAWAKVINKAYEAGVTIVTAAGNSWLKGLGVIAPKKVLYPARFDRVIAATGVAYNNYPYVAKANPEFGKSKAAGGEYMQGNYYPKSAMRTAIAAYTPNVPWSVFKDKEKKDPIILKNGGGTSSATPQIAAAAALWITKNKEELKAKGYYGTWKQVEAVRYALFKSARKRNIIGWEKYYGNGILQARAALDIPVPSEDQLRKSKKARVTLGILKYLKLIVLRKSAGSASTDFDEVKGEMIFQEIIQVLEQDPKLIELYGDIDLLDMAENEQLTSEQFREICLQVAQSPYTSGFFKKTMQIL